MKLPLLTLLILALNLNFYAQTQCFNYIGSTTDRMTGKTYTTSKKAIIVSANQKSGFAIRPVLSDGRIILSIKTIGGGCIDQSNPIYVLFTDNSRLQLTNDAKFNCDDEAFVYFSAGANNFDELKILTTKKIEAMRVTTLKSSVEEDFTAAQANIFQKTMDCLMIAGGDEFVEPETSEKTVSGGVVNGKAIKLARPFYPIEARGKRAGGTVNVQVVIDEEGKVISASAVSGHPLLKPAAETAAKESLFSPTVLSGRKVKVKGVIVYNFTAQ